MAKWTWLWKLTGGRPMRFIRSNFMDVVSGAMVNDYMDRNGKFWMAENRWAILRVPLRGDQIMDALQNNTVPFTEMAWGTINYGDGRTERKYIPFDRAALARVLSSLDELRHPAVSSGDDH